MRITMKAIEGGGGQDDDILFAGVATEGHPDDGDGHFLNFQRGADEEQLYFEFDDQGYSNFNVVRLCRLSRNLLSIDLTEPFDNLEDVEGFDAELAIDDESYEQLKTGLERIFQGTSAELLIQ